MKTIFIFLVLGTINCGVGDHMPVPSSPGSINLNGIGPVSYKKDLLPIFSSRCATCHNSTSPPAQPNWLDESIAASHKKELYQRIWVTRDMPTGGNITERERALIAAWTRGGEYVPQLGGSVSNGPTEILAPGVGTKGNFGKDPVSRGEYLTRAADCLFCHTASRPNAPVGAGGLRMRLSFGDLYTPNITPDNETGIGTWTPDDFYGALHHGIRKNGEYLYPAFPFTSFTKIPRSEVDDIFTYLRTLRPVANRVDVNHLHFPFSIRAALAVWRGLYFKPGDFIPDETKSNAWNRGQYLVMGPGHCEACHTPRNYMGALDKDKEFEGAEIDNWYASNLRYSIKNGISQWSEDDLVNFLGTGSARGKATVVGPMSEVVNHSLQYLTLSDLQAMALYLKSISSAGYYDENQRNLEINMEHGRWLYNKNCAECHRADGLGTPGAYPPFFQNPVINQDDSSNLINVLLSGIPSQNGYDPMPSFASKLSDREVACIANYVRTQWGSATETNVTAKFVSEKRSALIDKSGNP